jgi:radical SAM-linked protein
MTACQTACKVRLRFRKAGDLRFLSHHDLLRAVERMLRRADLPFASTRGFHPKPKIAFAAALQLGVVGAAEVLEIELTEDLSPEEVRNRLQAVAPAGLEFLSAARIDPRRNAQVVRATYRLRLPELPPDLPDRVAGLLGQDEVWVERSRPTPRRFDLRPFLEAIRPEGGGLTFVFSVTPHGSARPEDLLPLLGLGDFADVVAAGGVLERTGLELADEAGPEGPRQVPNKQPRQEPRQEPRA